MKLQITIWNATGEVVMDEEVDAPTATEEEIAEMVSLIENGCPAWLASSLVIPLSKQARRAGGEG